MTQDAFTSKLFYVIVVFLITLYVVFVQKSQSTVESALHPTKIVRTPHVSIRSSQKG